MSTGPKTKEGIERIRQAHLKDGNETLAAKKLRSEQLLKLALLEDMMYVLNMATGSRTRGPKPLGYKRLTSIEEIQKVFDK